MKKMSANGQCFVEWKEQFVSQERGHRVVHYFLKDSTGNFILAVVGTERSVRHMFYVVADEFLNAYGSENSVHAGFKWRSRREVVDWLTSMLSKHNLPGDGSGQFIFFFSLIRFRVSCFLQSTCNYGNVYMMQTMNLCKLLYILLLYQFLGFEFMEEIHESCLVFVSVKEEERRLC